MKKSILFSLVSLVCCASAYGATTFVPWWTRPTVCRVNPQRCYSQTEESKGGFVGDWDETGNCWGMKLICSDALVDKSSGVPVAMGLAEIAAGGKINPDFDINKLNDSDECFGSRKTSSNGTQVAVDGKYTNVWCEEDVLNHVAIPVDGGFVFDVSPTCAELASNGYIGILSGKCYGKKYDVEEFFIECGTSGLIPERIIVLNGAQNTAVSEKVPVDAAAADKLFDRMYSVSQSQHKKYFKE